MKSIKYIKNKPKDPTKSKEILDLISLFITIASLISALLLFLNQFSPTISLLTSAVITLIYYLKNKKSYPSISTAKSFSQAIKDNQIILIILLISIIFRLKSYNWIYGGQDQGLYINMGAHYLRNGSNFITDKVRSILTESEKNAYDKIGHIDPQKKFHHLSILYQDIEKSKYYFDFYPLHPLWLANFASIFGQDKATYSLLFFSILSIYSVYLLTKHVSNNQTAGYIAASLLAVNPLHAFFSKFPTTEILSVFLSSSMFYYFLKYQKSLETNKVNKLFLILTVTLFFCLYLNHIATFLYLPLLLLIFFANNRKTNLKLTFFYFSIFLATALTNLYYYFRAPTLLSTYPILFNKIAISKTPLINIALIIFLLSLFFYLYLQEKIRQKIIHQISSNKFLRIIFLVSLILLIYQISIFASTPVENKQGSGQGWLSLNYSSLVTLIRYLSPIAFPILLLPLNKNKDWQFKSIFIFFIYFFFIRLAYQITLPYQYYYARYLLPETLTYSIILVSIFISQLLNSSKSNNKKIAYILLISILTYYFYYTSFQFKGTELRQAKMSLDQISNNLGDHDLLINDVYYMPEQLGVPLENYYNKNVITSLNYLQTINDYSYSINNYFKNIYILSPIPIKDQNLIFRKQIPIFIDEFEHINKIPTKFTIKGFNTYLYQIKDKKNYSLGS